MAAGAPSSWIIQRRSIHSVIVEPPLNEPLTSVQQASPFVPQQEVSSGMLPGAFFLIATESRRAYP
jgi:hypothetical protein